MKKRNTGIFSAAHFTNSKGVAKFPETTMRGCWGDRASSRSPTSRCVTTRIVTPFVWLQCRRPNAPCTANSAKIGPWSYAHPVSQRREFRGR
jgi:hypothetical protein